MSQPLTEESTVDGRFTWAFHRASAELETTVPTSFGRGLILTVLDVERLALLLADHRECINLHVKRIREGLDVPADANEKVSALTSIDGRTLWELDPLDGAMRWALPHGSSFYLSALDIARLARLLQANAPCIIVKAQEVRYGLGITEEDTPMLTEDTIIYG